ncbi:MAG: tyrosine-type recombinase/integrase [Planctomycetales bacterium]
MTREPWKITAQMFLSVPEVDALLAHLDRRIGKAPPDLRHAARIDRLIVETLLFSGLRNSELCRLTLDDLRLESIPPTLEVRGVPRESRSVAIPSRLATLLREYLADLRPQSLREPQSRKAPRTLLLNDRGRPYERTSLYRRVVKILTEAGLETRASVQLLRHTYGYLAYLRTGGNLLFVQRQLGHAHPMVTAVYAEFVEFSAAELANAVVGDPVAPPLPPVSRRRRK